MMLHELFVKIAKGEKLTPSEMEELYFVAQDLDRLRGSVGGWVGVDGEPRFNQIHSHSGDFEVSPIEGLFATRVGNQSVPHDTETAVSFNSHSANNNFFTMDGSKVKIFNPSRTIGVFGAVEWATNGTGRRGIHLNLYDAADVNLTGVTLHSLLPTGLDADTMPFAGGFWFPSAYEDVSTYPTATHLRLTVVQTSGGALNMQNLRAFFFLVK